MLVDGLLHIVEDDRGFGGNHKTMTGHPAGLLFARLSRSAGGRQPIVGATGALTEQETIDGMSALAWLGAAVAVVILALCVAALPRPARILRRPAARPTGAGAAQAKLEFRFARGARTAQDDRRRRVDLGAERA
jgi:hypothetical protein